ncbi:uncharacterized protein LOC110686402 [Chenopodium quinoa]|uniref:uncharacterized protein LOC110686402 n=1 Tax=Chenopodium quinoa TaxID=63459 RepID=UPI000B788FD9|nr:uncharacterized protein LOC110686402 [Chenopodium quinoa]
MGLQSICCSFGSPTIPQSHSVKNVRSTVINAGHRKIQLNNLAESYAISNLKWGVKDSLLPRVKEVSRIYALHSDSNEILEVPSKSNANIPEVHSDLPAKSKLSSKYDSVEPFGGKSGSVSFYGLTHHAIEESKLSSSPYKDDGGSVIWILAPLVLILSLILPPIILSNAFDGVFKNEALAEIVGILSSEAVFYSGIAIFLLITDRIQRPYLQFSAKRWSLITGLKGHLSTSFFAMGLKVIAPIAVTYATWPVIGMNAVVAVTPLLVGYLAQYALEAFIDKRGSACWPLVPIIFEVYRFYQLTRAITYVEGLRFVMSGVEATQEVVERSGALAAVSVTFYFVALVCLWSLLTFLLRLFPSRPVSEKY